TDEVKYSGEQDNFNFKFKIFENYCLRAGVPKQTYIIAIPTILCGLALKFPKYPVLCISKTSQTAITTAADL
ncbi:uncharacterized protein K441DRAFT_650552, partial [Cenococcum geophilum 1.58]|uniref:uncharacterized protein n=1 Tax=Cenococcum geophilum 1.58 TaxID=794803 RepID=UPI00358E3DF8